jgi:mannose-1-phosphate guanylyltransferase
LMPELWNGLLKLRVAWNSFDKNDVLEKVWEGLKPQTIDYGIMEKASKVAVIPAASLGWSDVGNWESLFEVLPSDDNGNVIVGAQHIGIDTNNAMIYAEKSKRLIVTLGARNLIIVDTGDTLLVCPREEAQNVKKIIDLLSDMGREEYL